MNACITLLKGITNSANQGRKQQLIRFKKGVVMGWSLHKIFVKVGGPQLDLNAGVINHMNIKETVGCLGKNIVRAEAEKKVSGLGEKSWTHF